MFGELASGSCLFRCCHLRRLTCFRGFSVARLRLFRCGRSRGPPPMHPTISTPGPLPDLHTSVCEGPLLYPAACFTRSCLFRSGRSRGLASTCGGFVARPSLFRRGRSRGPIRASGDFELRSCLSQGGRSQRPPLIIQRLCSQIASLPAWPCSGARPTTIWNPERVFLRAAVRKCPPVWI